MSKVLIVDDDPAVLFALEEAIRERRHDVVAVSSGTAALAALDGVDVAISDYSMPDMDGIQLLERLAAIDSTLPVIMVTAHGSERLAVRALKQGAYDYLTKPFDNDELFYSIERAAETRRFRLDERASSLEQAVGVRIVGHSPALARLLESAARVANKDVTVLVRGETGTGKELVASLLHARSARAKHSLVVFNSAAIPHELAEAQLFGHAKGAFTGAVASHVGFFAQANGGTLFLDEVGELRLDVQAKLLRALQEREVQPLGSNRIEKVDVRVVAATHRDLLAEVKAGRFREDLYYRLNVVELVVPPLRERIGDIPLLAREFARKYSERFGLGYVVQIAPELVEYLEREPWPGNVRQLENTIARCIALATTKIIGLEALEPSTHPGDVPPASSSMGPSFREQVEAFERGLINHALAASGGNQSETARRLHLNRASLYDKLKKYGISKE
ncbi:MAG: two component, sigma54 specific, transcriptional regulator, Fis family [Myxococcales bacterium]|nr:two component, sigma54 specific, transcriptional regulator, Fis family [Myxococcales bacterium]